MATGNLDAAGLIAAADNGLINEDVMQQIFDISTIPLEFTDMMGAPDTIDNPYAEWTQDTLSAVDVDNAAIDGADIGTDDSVVGVRVGNHAQISRKAVFVSERARATDNVGRSDELSYQVMQRQKELRRDVEAIMCGQQASIADDGAAVPGLSAGFGAWLETNTIRGALGADGGYGATSPGIVDAPTTGTEIALSEEAVRDVSQLVFEQGGNPTKAMTTPTLKRKFSEYLYTDGAKIATLDQDVGGAMEQATAKGAVDVFLSDFSILALVANRLQQIVEADNTNFYIIDPEMVRQGILKGYNVEPLGKEGLADRRQMSVDWTLKVLTEKAHGVVADVNAALPVLSVPA